MVKNPMRGAPETVHCWLVEYWCSNLLCLTIWITAVVDKPANVPFPCRIDNLKYKSSQSYRLHTRSLSSWNKSARCCFRNTSTQLLHTSTKEPQPDAQIHRNQQLRHSIRIWMRLCTVRKSWSQSYAGKSFVVRSPKPFFSVRKTSTGAYWREENCRFWQRSPHGHLVEHS